MAVSMQTLIFNGSAKKDVDTVALINAFVSHLKGDIKILSSRNDIHPCDDCRHCWDKLGCSVQDEMQDVYRYLETCDNIVLASPIWFSSLSGPLLNMASRIQSIWAANYFQKKKLILKEKKGVIILVGGQPETKDIPTQTALGIMRYMNVHRPSVETIYSLETNTIPAKNDLTALERCRQVAEQLNQSYTGQ